MSRKYCPYTKDKKLYLGCILTYASFLSSTPAVYLTLKQQVWLWTSFGFDSLLTFREKIKSLNFGARLFSLVQRVCFDFNIKEH